MQTTTTSNFVDFNGMSLMQRLALDTPQTTKMYTAIQQKIAEANKSSGTGTENQPLRRQLRNLEARRYFTCIADDLHRIATSVLHVKAFTDEKIIQDSKEKKSNLGLRKFCHYAQATAAAPFLMAVFTIKSIRSLFCLHRLFMPFFSKTPHHEEFFEAQAALREKKISPVLYLFNQSIFLNVVRRRENKKNADEIGIKNNQENKTIENQDDSAIIKSRFGFFASLFEDKNSKKI